MEGQKWLVCRTYPCCSCTWQQAQQVQCLLVEQVLMLQQQLLPQPLLQLLPPVPTVSPLLCL